jgi:hypothetical protein
MRRSNRGSAADGFYDSGNDAIVEVPWSPFDQQGIPEQRQNSANLCGHSKVPLWGAVEAGQSI